MGCGLSKAHHRPEVLVSHRNARTTFQGRLLCRAVRRVGLRLISPRRWVFPESVCARGSPGMTPKVSRPADRSSRPHTMPTRTPDAVEDQIVALRGFSAAAQRRSAPNFGVTARTVSRVLRRRNVPYLRDCDPMTGELIRASKTTAVRYEENVRASWCTWTSKSWVESLTAAAGVPSGGNTIARSKTKTRQRIRLRAFTRRRPLPIGLLRDPG